MKPFARFANRYWIGGIMMALAGVTLARFVAPFMEKQPRFYATAAGQLLALGGLWVIALGVRRRFNMPSGEVVSSRDI